MSSDLTKDSIEHGYLDLIASIVSLVKFYYFSILLFVCATIYGE